jgi:AbrB family looped-hinge helix DNA binding protein
MMKGDMKFFGSVTIGERGQIVVPAEARTALGLKPGDKMLVFKAPVDGAIVVAKPEEFERHVQQMGQRAAELQRQLEKENGK